MQFPVSHPDDGLIDISIQEIVRFIRTKSSVVLLHWYLRSEGNSYWKRWKVLRLAVPIGSALCVYELWVSGNLLILFNRTDTSKRLHTVLNLSQLVAR